MRHEVRRRGSECCAETRSPASPAAARARRAATMARRRAAEQRHGLATASLDDLVGRSEHQDREGRGRATCGLEVDDGSTLWSAQPEGRRSLALENSAGENVDLMVMSVRLPQLLIEAPAAANSRY